MSDAPHIAEPDDLDAVHRAALKRLREMGMEIAERLHAQMQDSDTDIGEVATRFARVARTVRQTIHLESRLADETRRRAEAQAREAARLAEATADRAEWAPMWDPSPRCREARNEPEPPAKKLEAITLMHRLIARDVDRERLADRFHERLTERGDNYDVVMTGKSVDEAIRYICRDLDFTPDWLGLSDRDWQGARPETRAALLGAAPRTANPANRESPEPAAFIPPPAGSGYNPPDPWPRGPP